MKILPKYLVESKIGRNFAHANDKETTRHKSQRVSEEEQNPKAL